LFFEEFEQRLRHYQIANPRRRDDKNFFSIGHLKYSNRQAQALACVPLITYR